jgi:hypothetical protein
VDISGIVFRPAPRHEVKKGIIGWASFRVNDALEIQGVAVRFTADRRYVLSFPAKRDGHGGRHFYVRPLDDRARRDIEHQVLRALGYSLEAQP